MMFNDLRLTTLQLKSIDDLSSYDHHKLFIILKSAIKCPKIMSQ
jgi:hypothetical protein